MRSESEIRWVRARNLVGAMTKLTSWHAVIPGVGDIYLKPGTACSTELFGDYQFTQHSAIRYVDGHIHEKCMELALDFIAEITGVER